MPEYRYLSTLSVRYWQNRSGTISGMIKAPTPAHTQRDLKIFITLIGIATSVVSGIQPSIAAPATPRGNIEDTVTLEFPANRSMGKLFRLDLKYPAGPRRVGHYVEARGRVTVPASCKLMLELSYAGTEDLSPLTQIKTDSLYSIDAGHVDNFNDKGLDVISHLTSVKTLTVDDTDITDKGMHSIGQMTQLIALSMQQLTLSASGIAEIQHLKNLQRLRMVLVHLDETSAKNLSGLVNLTYLNVSHCSVTSEMLQNLKSMQNMITLHLQNNKKITDKGLIYLNSMSHLTVLDLQDTSVTAACGKSLKGLGHLAELAVSLPTEQKLLIAKELPHCRVSNELNPPVPIEVFAPLK